MTTTSEDRLTALAQRLADRADTNEVIWRIERPGTGWTWSFGDQDRSYFLASITKLFVTALILQLVDAGTVRLDSAAADYLPVSTMTGLNVFGGKDRGKDITVRHLLSNTSGVPDYFDDRGGVLGQILAHDRGWSDQEALTITRGMTPRFAPRADKAHYSDTNFQLLGMIVESVTGGSYEHAVTDRVLEPCGLTRTYPFTKGELERYSGVAGILSGRDTLHIPLAMASTRAQGGMVSTAAESVEFLTAFLSGQLFDPSHLPALTSRLNRVFGPMRYGLGVMEFKIPRVLSPFAPVPALTGHSGSSGTVLYHSEQHDLYIAGAVNQVKNRRLIYQTLAKMTAIAARS